MAKQEDIHSVAEDDEDYERVLPCPVCGSIQFPYYGSWEVCDQCHWVDDPVQTDNPDEDGGGNFMSLNQAREAYHQGKPIKRPCQGLSNRMGLFHTLSARKHESWQDLRRAGKNAT